MGRGNEHVVGRDAATLSNALFHRIHHGARHHGEVAEHERDLPRAVVEHQRLGEEVVMDGIGVGHVTEGAAHGDAQPGRNVRCSRACA